jgi:hypothetical protein
MVSSTFMISFFILYIANYLSSLTISVVIYISLPLVILFCLVSFREGMDFFGLMTIFGNPIIAVFQTDMVPLVTGLKRLL